MFVSRRLTRLSGSLATPCCSTFDLHNEQQSGLVWFWGGGGGGGGGGGRTGATYLGCRFLLNHPLTNNKFRNKRERFAVPPWCVYHFTSSLGSGESPASTFDLVVPVARAGRFLPGLFLLPSSSSSPYIFTTRDT